MKHARMLVGSALLAGCAVGCAMEGDTSESVRQKEENIFYRADLLWDDPNIPVCWENGTTTNATERAWVRQAVERTWQYNANVTFTGWGACVAGSDGIRIRIADVGPHVKGLGTQLDGMINGMVLNFTFDSWSTSCNGREQYCIETIAVHEFGHALGFAHEQNRPDTPNWCDEEQGTDGNTLTGPWDLDSVMNYCNPEWSGDGELSLEDIRGIQQAYGPSPGSLRLRHKESGQCLYNATPNNGGRVNHHACWDDPNMDFELVPLTGHGFGAVRLRHRGTNTCIYGNENNGGRVHHWTCWDDPNMVYVMEDLGNNEFRLRHKQTGKCLYATGGNGGGTFNWSCWDDPAMVFTLENANPRRPAVCFYKHAQFEGESSCYGYGDVPYVGGGVNDTFSSVSVIDESSVTTAYQHSNFGGAQLEVTAHQSGFSSFWNDQISSLRVERVCQEALECARGTFNGAGCLLGTVPSDRDVFVSGGDLYYSAAETCAEGSHDTANCYLGALPAGSTTFKYANNLYYTPVNGNQCPVPHTGWDTANCYVGSLDDGFFAWGGGIYRAGQPDPNSCTVGGAVFEDGKCRVAGAEESPWFSGQSLYVARAEVPDTWPVPDTTPTYPVDEEWAPVTYTGSAFQLDLLFFSELVSCSDVTGYQVELSFGGVVVSTLNVAASGEDADRGTVQIPMNRLGQQHSWRVRPALQGGTFGPWSDSELFTPDLIQ